MTMRLFKNAMPRVRRAMLIGLAIVPAMACADPGYPNRPIKILLGFTPGSSSDAVLRMIAKPLSERLGTPVVVENKSGAGGIIAAESVAKAPGDGYTLLFLASAHATSAAMKKSLPYHPINDFSWITSVVTYPMALAVAPASPFRSFAEVLQAAKANPKKYSYSSVGVGTAHHLLGEWVLSESGAEMVHVPYRGGAGALAELLGGRIDFMFDTMTGAAPLAKEKRINLLAISSPKGQSPVSGVPTIADSLPGVVYESWLGIAAPPNTSPAIIERLNREVRGILAQDDINRKLAEMGATVKPGSPAEFRERIEKDISIFKKVIVDRKIEQE